MLDINGQELSEHDLVQLLCEIVEMRDDAVRVRILNSEQELEVSTVAGDEVLGLHVSSELTKLEGSPTVMHPALVDVFDSQADGVKAWPME